MITNHKQISFVSLYTKTIVESDSDDDNETPGKSSCSAKNKDSPIEDKMFPEVAFAVDKAILREVEEMEEKVFQASLQVKVIFNKYSCTTDGPVDPEQFQLVLQYQRQCRLV